MAKSLRVGRNRQRVRLYDVPEATTDSIGDPSQDAVLIGTFWAFIRPLMGDEILNIRQQWPKASHKAWMRWLGSSIPKTADNPNGWIVPSMKLICEDNSYVLNVLFADRVEMRNRYWILTCEERVGATA